MRPSRTAGTSAPGASGVKRVKTVVVPTNTVTTKDGRTVRTRIEATLPVADVVRQLCLNLQITEAPSLYALRDDQGQLVTDDNLRKKVRDKAALKLVSSPQADALDIVNKMAGRQEHSPRMTLFSLQKCIKEEPFVNEFLKRGGLNHLLNAIESSQGNTLAYALTSLQNLMVLDYGWASLPPELISGLAMILSKPSTPINVCRPATSVLKRLVEADARYAPTNSGPSAGGSAAAVASSSSSRSPPPPPPGSIWRFGFDVVWREIAAGLNVDAEGVDDNNGMRSLLEVLVQRLGSSESEMVSVSMRLLNTLMSHASDRYWDILVGMLEKLNVRRAVIRLMASGYIEDLNSSILDFQANYVRITYRRKTTPVDMDSPEVQRALRVIWDASKVDELEGNTARSIRAKETGKASVSRMQDEMWAKLGFGTENLRGEFARVGTLGLECLESFAMSDLDYFAKVVLEQLNRQPERRCPVAMASNEVVELLTDYWSVFAPGYSTSTSYQPFFLSFPRVHNLATRFFLRMWNESGAGYDDFPRVSSLVRSQIKVALADEATRPWHEVEAIFLEAPYRQVRERQMKELEQEDELLSKPPVRNLRAKLYKESYDFVRQQRIMCLMQGAWFANGIPVLTNNGVSGTVTSGPSIGGASPAMDGPSRDSIGTRRPTRPWRFYRLDKMHKYLHYVESQVKIPIRPGLDDLPEKIEISLIAEIAIGTCALPSNIAMPETHTHTSPFTNVSSGASPLSFTIMSYQGTAIADQVSENASRFADWVDGLNMLRESSGLGAASAAAAAGNVTGRHIGTQETAMYVQALTEIGLKIKLLDLSGEKVDIPSALTAGPPPTNTDFFFSDPVMFSN